MKKITPYLLVALLFVSNPGIIFAEEFLDEVAPQEQFIEEEQTQDQILDLSIENNQEEVSEEINQDLGDEQELNIQNQENFSTTTEQFESTENDSGLTAITVNLTLRYNEDIIFAGSVELTKDATTTISDNSNVEREIKEDTVLGALHTIDQENDLFSISDLSYYSSFDSFLLNCLNINSGSINNVNACYNWQYVVNDSYPYIGIDKYQLEDGDSLYFYFANPRIIDLSTSTILVGQSVTAIAKSYDYYNDEYVPLVGYVIGVTQPGPANPWSPIIVATSSSDESGQAVFTLNNIGNYGIGLEADYYYPVYNVEVINSTTTSDGGGGGGTNSSNKEKINIQEAIDYLISKQNSNGSFGADLYTDWSAIALSSISENSNSRNIVKSYLRTDKISGSILTDFERRAMALMSLEINPYSGSDTNYISKIIEYFDGSQFGENDLVNDDIFALFPLLNAGYDSNDEEIKKATSFIISKQNSNGSWESLDLTAAAIQALVLVRDLPQVNSSISKARSYLKSQQRVDGGFGNVFVTSWAVQAIVAMGEDPSSWLKSGNDPYSYLSSQQNDDGSLQSEGDTNSKLWATAYLIPAYYEKTWDDLLSNFSKKEDSSNENNSNSGQSSNNENATSTIETVSESNEIEATSSPELLNLPSVSESLFVGNLSGELKEDIEDNMNEIIPEVQGLIDQEENTLSANALDGLNVYKTKNIILSILTTILAGFNTLLAFAVSLFNL